MTSPSNIVRVSHKHLTRCDDCGRHVTLEGAARESLNRALIAAQPCPFCGGALARGRDESAPITLTTKGLGRRSSRLAAGLFAATAALTGCPDDEPVEPNTAGVQEGGAQAGAQGGAQAGAQGGVQPSPDMGITQALYGVMPDPDAGAPIPPYGVFPDPDMDVSGPDYGVFPAPDMEIGAPEYGVFPDPEDQGPPVEGGAQGGAQGG